MSASEDPNLSYCNDRSGMNAPAEAAIPASCLVAACDANAGDLAAVFAIVKAKTGHDFSSYKQSTILRRIERRLALHDATGLGEYLNLLESSQEEAQSLVQEILIGVTSFFRDADAFAIIRRDVIPRLFANRDPDEPVRIWHPCCATGEEVYSTAILIQEYLQERQQRARVQLFATDIDEAALSHARAGLFADESVAELGEDRLTRFFTRYDGRWQVAKQLREMIVFAHHSLVKDPPFSKLDLLVCRNFLIYLNPDMQKRLISLFHLVLKPGGILFLGAAETVGRNAGLFVPIDKKWKIFERAAGPRGDDTLFPFTAPVRRFSRMGQASRQDLAGEPSPDALAERVLLERYAPPFVVVNEKYEVIHVSARAGRFLEVPVGGPSRDVLRMAKGGLRPALRAAIYKAFSEQGKVSFPAVRIDDGEGGGVNVLVEPLAGGPSAEKLVMVVLEPAVMTPLLSPPSGAGVEVPGDETSKDMLIRQLEEQLRITHEQLRVTTEQLETSNEGFLSANEELMSINEEFQSANEELQSTNEELETSREELQALNEELVTVNGELQETVDELKQATGDMENLLASSEIATIFLDRQLAIKRFSPAMAALFNLIPADIGRPFRHPAGTLDWPEPDKDAALVLETLVTVEREITAVRDGRSFLMRVLPYRTTEGVVDGIVVTLVDISELKRLETQTVHLASFPQLNPNPVIEIDYCGAVIFANPAARTVVEQSGGDTESVTAFLPVDFAEIVDGWDKTCEVTFYREVAIEEKTFGETVFLSPQLDIVRIYTYDITERKQAEEALLRAKEEWERTFDSVPDLIAIIDSRHRIVRANRAMAAHLGVTPDECVGQCCYHGLHGTNAPAASCPHALTLTDGREHQVEVHEAHPGGDFLITTTPLLDESGQMIGTVHVARDITARKQAEEALRKAHDELDQRVRERTEDLATTVETLLGEITVRERAEKGLQRLNRLYAVLSETNQTIVRAADRDALFSDFCRIAVENGGFLLSWVGLADEESGQVKVAASWGASAYLDDIRISARNEPNGGGPTGIAIREGSSVICNDFLNDPCTRPWHEKGTRYGIRSSASIALKEEGRVIGALTLYAGEKDFFDRQHVALLQQMSADISFALDNFKREIRRREAEQALQNETLERLRTAESLREKEQLLMQQSRLAAMGEMINNIAHQWRQPLNVLGLNIQRLMLFYEMGDFSSAFLQTSTDDAMKLIKHMSQTIDDFRNFFKSDKEKTDFSVNQAIQLTISLVQDGLKSNHVEIVTHSDGNPLINGYYNEFCQVLLNILQNARDAIVERKIAAGKVSIASGVENGMTVITITDNAGGIPEEILGRIFEPYFSTKGVQGTGIGLFMSKNIIETNMGGKITVRNTTHGAEFRIEV